MRAAVVVASNRAAAGVYEDTTGPLIVAALEEAGFSVEPPLVVPDGEPVAEAIRGAIEGGARVVLTTGGTGLTPTDQTPEVTRSLLDREVPGVAEAIRAHGLSKGCRPLRCPAGWRGLRLCLSWSTSRDPAAGSRTGCRRTLLRHAVEQIVGSDH